MPSRPRRIRKKPIRWFAVVVIGLCLPGRTLAQNSSRVDRELAAAPIVAARQTAIDDRPFQRPLDADKIRQWMEISSRCTIAEFELFLSPLTPTEQQLVDKMESLRPPIVNRLHFEDLRTVLGNGQLSSYLDQQRIGSQLKHTTPALEEVLYGAYDCVFASVGPPDGSPRYGDVILRLKDSVGEHGWATPFSGMDFMYKIRHKDARKMQQLLASGQTLPSQPTSPLSLGFDDRLHFSHYVVTQEYWNKALAYQALLVARNADKSPSGERVRQRFAMLLEESTPREFWKVFIPARELDLPPEVAASRIPFGYLEGKFDDHISLADATSIEVPSEKIDEVLAWPEAQDFRQVIRAKASDAP